MVDPEEDDSSPPLTKNSTALPTTTEEQGKRRPPAKNVSQGGEPEAKRPKSDTPAYGSKEYWENRYQRQFNDADEAKEVESSAETLPYHAWYYSYADLRPLVVPLLIGGRNDLQDILAKAESQVEEADDEEGEDDEEEESESGEGNHVTQLCDSDDANSEACREEDAVQGENDGTTGNIVNAGNGSSGDGSDDDGFVEVGGDDDDDDDDEDAVEREGLSKKGPVSVLEVGCGDVPLGAGLALEFKEMEESTGDSAAKIFKQIICTDCSPTVVASMKTKYRNFKTSKMGLEESVDIGNIPLDFAVADARKLDYADGSFELVLEKGTLDAMLSDTEEGGQNCVKIIRELARVLTMEGYMVLVSHLNANTERGLQWLSDVVFEGLREGESSASWSIEVHGNAEIRDDSSAPAGSPGPAVYVIRKMEKDPSAPSEDAAIPVKFFSY